jgi:hypothetical protein
MQIGLSQDAPNYVYELWYQVFSNKSRGLNQYFKTQKADLQTRAAASVSWTYSRIAIPA